MNPFRDRLEGSGEQPLLWEDTPKLNRECDTADSHRSSELEAEDRVQSVEALEEKEGPGFEGEEDIHGEPEEPIARYIELQDGTIIRLPNRASYHVDEGSTKDGQDADEEASERSDNGYPPNSRVEINGVMYRTDDNGKPYMRYNKETKTYELLPDTEYVSNGYTYRTDGKGRIISAEGNVKEKNHEGRRPLNDALPDMKDSDERGHLIGDRFEGSNRLDNLVPMDKILNHKAYKDLEDRIAEAKSKGQNVNIKVDVEYDDDTKRPARFVVTVTIDGEKEVHVFENASDEEGAQNGTEND